MSRLRSLGASVGVRNPNPAAARRTIPATRPFAVRRRKMPFSCLRTRPASMSSSSASLNSVTCCLATPSCFASCDVFEGWYSGESRRPRICGPNVDIVFFVVDRERELANNCRVSADCRQLRSGGIATRGRRWQSSRNLPGREVALDADNSCGEG